MRLTGTCIWGGSAALLLSATVALAQRDDQGAGTGLEDMWNSVAGQADAAIAARGWRQVGGNGRVNYWWNERRGQCAAFVVNNGRYTTIQQTDPVDCGNGSGGSGWRPPITPPVGGGGWDDGRSDYADYSCSGTEGLVTVQIRGREGRIQLPRELTPVQPRDSRWGRPDGGYGEWWDLTSISTSRTRITARYTLAGAGTPRVTIDRRRGTISISGSNRYRYNGTCTAQMAPQPR